MPFNLGKFLLVSRTIEQLRFCDNTDSNIGQADWETAMLAIKGRVTIALPVAAWRRDLLRLGLLEFPIDGDIGTAAAQLDLHGDPADRLIVATAQIKGAALLTADQPLLQWSNVLERLNARR